MTARGHANRRTSVQSPNEPLPEEVPSGVVTAAKEVFGRRSPGPLAVLVFDSLLDDDRSPEQRLRFEHRVVRIDLAVSASGEACLLRAAVTPSDVHIDLELAESEVPITAEPVDGEFVINHVPHGVVRLMVAGARLSAVHTDWFRV